MTVQANGLSNVSIDSLPCLRPPDKSPEKYLFGNNGCLILPGELQRNFLPFRSRQRKTVEQVIVPPDEFRLHSRLALRRIE